MRRIAGLREIAGSIRPLLIEQFGVLHDGVAPYPRTIDGLAKIAAYGRKIIILTNSGKCAAANRRRPPRTGFAGSCLSGIVRLGRRGPAMRQERDIGTTLSRAQPVCVIGDPRGGDDHYAITSDDFELVDQPQDAAPFWCLPDPTCRGSRCRPIKMRWQVRQKRTCPAICINPDIATIRHGEIVPAAEAIARLYEDLGGSVGIIGKPHLLISRPRNRNRRIAARRAARDGR